jgi:dipeptidyl aminopeptidase/acylaminoacyl peptidase
MATDLDYLTAPDHEACLDELRRSEGDLRGSPREGAGAVRLGLLLLLALAGKPACQAQMQVVAKYEGEMLPVVDCSSDSLYVQKGGDKEKTDYGDYTIRSAGAFGAGFVEIANVKADLNPLKQAPSKERLDPKAFNFRYEADITADRDLKPSFALLTFASEGSVGTWFVPIGRLRQAVPKHVSIAFHDRVGSVGRLHVFAQGAEVKSTQVGEPYDVRAYYASLVRDSGPSALELLKLNETFPYVLSNDGRLLATLRDRETYYAIVVYDLDARKVLCETKTEDHDTDISDLTWVSDHELAYVSASGWVRSYYYRWYHSASDLMLLDVRAGTTAKIEDGVQGIVEALHDHPDTLLLNNAKAGQGTSFTRFDIRTRKNTDLDDPEGGEFLFDNRGNARVHIRYGGEYLIRPRADSGWVELNSFVKTPGLRFKFEAKDMLDRVADVLALGPDGDTLYISTRLNRDLFQLDAFSMSEGVIKRTIATHPKYDLSDSDFGLTHLLFRKHSADLVGMVYQAERPEVVWLDPKFKAVQHAMDTACPDHANLPVDWSEDGSTFVYFSMSDRDPGTYYIFRPEKGMLAPLLSLGEHLKGRKLATTEAFDFTARDGATVHAYVTYPPQSSGPVPLVVDVHGGPMVRDGWGFDAERQFLAARGYAVLQVNYRGSSGFGAKYQFAGLKSRLDTVVIDDIADGARHVIAQGRVDPARVAVIGASFGGWATYMSLIRYPEIYRAGVVTAGVAHWRNILKKDRWLSAREFSYVFWKSLLDRQGFKDDEPLIDPYIRAAEIKQPIYILQGENDPVVDAEEARMMAKKLQGTNSQVEFLLFPGAGHSEDQWSFTDKVRRLNEIANFLDRQVKDSAAPRAEGAVADTSEKTASVRP